MTSRRPRAPMRVMPHPDDAAHVAASFAEDAAHPERRKTLSDPELKSWATAPAGLVGHFFHSFSGEGNARRVEWQGHVVAAVGIDEAHYLVETFSWMDGDPWTRRIVHVSQMLTWDFYETAERMNEIYQAKWRVRPT